MLEFSRSCVSRRKSIRKSDKKRSLRLHSNFNHYSLAKAPKNAVVKMTGNSIPFTKVKALAAASTV